jgi:hypothetical protein
MEDYVYSQFVAPIIKTLYCEVMIIGLFGVTIWYVRCAHSLSTTIGDPNFWKRVILLAAVMLFTIYIVVSYQIDSAPAVRPGQFANSESLISVQIAILVITPLELLMVALGAGLFLVLAMDAFAKSSTDVKPTFQLKDEPGHLFLITGTWHSCCAIWWLINIYRDGSGFGYSFHVTFALLHYLSLMLWKRWSANTERAQNVREWVAICIYSALIIGVYISRLGWYVRNAIERPQ